MTLDQGTAWEGYRPGLLLFISQALWGGLLMVATTEEGFLVYPTVSDITQLVNTNLPLRRYEPYLLSSFPLFSPFLLPSVFFLLVILFISISNVVPPSWFPSASFYSITLPSSSMRVLPTHIPTPTLLL